jgi:hypothetical protein
MRRDVVERDARQRLASSRQRERLVPVDGRVARAMTLQRRVGNRAFGRLVQREVTRDPPGTWITEGVRRRAAAEVERVERQIAEQRQRLKDLERVSEDLVGEDLGLSIRPVPREPPAAGTPVNDPPAAGTPVNRRGVPLERPLEERLAEAAAGEGPAAEEAGRLLRERRVNKRWINKRLEEIADRGGRRGEAAGDVLRDLREADKELGRLRRILKPKGPRAGAANTPKTTPYKIEDSAGAAGKSGEKAPASEPGVKVEGSPGSPEPRAGTASPEPTVAAERVGEDAAADVAGKAAGTAAEGLTFAESVGAVLEVIGPVLDVLLLAEAGYALGKALIFHNPGEMDPEQLKFMHLMDTNVMRPAFKALEPHEQEARKLALRDSERDVYAKVTMTITYGAEGALSKTKEPTMVYDDEHLEDVQFNTLSVGYDSKTAKKDGGETHHRADYGDHRRRMQIVTFPILLNPLGQSRGVRRFVAMRANAANAIAKGLSARSIAERTHWVGDHMGPGGYDWTYLDDREEARRKKAMAPSHRAEVELAAKVAFTEAYIDAASDHMDQPAVKKLYDDAVQYYDELKRTTIDPLWRPVTIPKQQQYRFPLKPR